MSHSSRSFRILVLPVIVAAAACTDESFTDPVSSEPSAASLVPAPPPVVVPISFGGFTNSIWPFTGRNFEDAADPINVAFVGRVDPLALRAALLSLDGNRSAFGFPAAAPFDCTWADAIGGIQTAYGTASGWTGSAIQLDCGGYGPLRFHLRLFESGQWTLGGAHFEVLIPGTAEHEVLSWELAEQFVTVDFLRTGLLDSAVPVSATTPISPAPSYREINPLIYNGLPAALVAALGTPLPPVASPVPIPNDGVATILNVARQVEVEPSFVRTDFELQYNQIVPRPFCSAGSQDFVQVRGPVTLSQTVRVTSSRDYIASARIHGSLDVAVPGSAEYGRRARIDRQFNAFITHAGPVVSDRFSQMLLPRPGEPLQFSRAALHLGPRHGDYSLIVRCN